MAVVYRHVRIDKNQVFYIGIGDKTSRAYSNLNRNKYWRHIVNKSEYRVEILFDDLIREEACEKEKELISLYGRIDLGTGTLVNMTDGGEGTIGYKPTEETLKKMSINSSGENNPMFGNGYRLEGEKNGRYGKGYLIEGSKNPNSKKVAQIDPKTGEVIKIWEYKKLAAITLNICETGISEACNGKQKTSGKFKWKYVK